MAKTLKIWCYDTESDTKYLLYSSLLDDSYSSTDRIVDAVSYPENGIDNLYFTDNYHELRRLRCEIPTPYTAGFLADEDLSLQRRGANGKVSLNTITTGGSLLSGTYQFAYRMVDPDNNVYTKWSTLTNPIHVYSKTIKTLAGPITEAEVLNSGYGMATDRKISLSIEPSPSEASFAYYQLAVVENIYPTADTSLSASILSVQQITPGSTASYDYKANDKVDSIAIEELVVDYSALAKSKTLSISNNRLIVGNIEYKELDILASTPSNLAPSVSGSIVSQELGTVLTSGSQELEASRKKGYFRDEVYRFGIVYYDKFGNKSAPYVLNMSSVVGNTITSGVTDVKFPNRHDRSSVNTSLLNDSGVPLSLGLYLTINNHPSWAVGFEIVREKRIKRILYQTPVIPMVRVKGVGAFETYPATAIVPGPVSQSYTSAQPQTSDEVYVPKNLLWPEARSIVKNTTTAGAGLSRTKLGESELQRQSQTNLVIVYPQEAIYENKEYTAGGFETLETVDYVLAKSLRYNYDEVGTAVQGDDQDTNISVTFYGLEDNYYYYDANASKSRLSSTVSNVKITDSVYIDNLSEGTYLKGNKILTHSDLQTEGIVLGRKPLNHRMVVCKLENSIDDEGSIAINFAAGTHNAYPNTPNRYIVGSSGPLYIESANYTNEYVLNQAAAYSGVGNTTLSEPVQVIRVGNIINPNIADTRYGESDSAREFISTGAKHVFTSGQLTSVQSKTSTPISLYVWGGDCLVTHHAFRVADSAYSVVNQNKHTTGYQVEATLLDKWGAVFRLDTNAILTMPVAVKCASQNVQIYIESEYNGQVREYDVIGATSNIQGSSLIYNSQPLYSDATSARSCLLYNINRNLIKENDQKVYVPLPDFFNIQYAFGSRIHYSDIKIYNSSEKGFDIFRTGNFYDLQESGGDLTKLAVAADNLYAIQKRRTSYLPVGRRQLETTDAGILAVGSSDFLSDARIIDPTRGSQHLAGIVQTGSLIIFPDNINKAVYALAGQEMDVISDSGMNSYFRNKFGTVFDEKNIRSVYDPVKKEYWIVGTDFCYVYNFGLKAWITNYEFSGLAGGRYTNQKLYLVSSPNVSVYSMYTGDYSQLFGTEVTPRVSFVVNPDGDYSKTFDDVSVIATERLSSIDFSVEREESLGQQSVTEVNLDVLPVEGNYRIKTLRDAREERLRGGYMTSVIKWTKNNILSVLSSVYTKYRLSSRRPF